MKSCIKHLIKIYKTIDPLFLTNQQKSTIPMPPNVPPSTQAQYTALPLR
jgi:hypothetical protein